MTDLLLADSATKLDSGARRRVLICGSHGGVYPAYLAALAGVRAVILNDAGIGKDSAGIGGLAYLDRLGLAAATASHLSARIADSADMAARGVVSHVNAAARALGCAPGQPVGDCARRMTAAVGPSGPPPAYDEARTLVRHDAGRPPVWAVDSASLVGAEDAGAIVVTGSHGGLLGGRPDAAMAVDVLAAVFNDAGVGIERAGIARLDSLDRRNIPAATVAAASARIGDGRSTYEDGILSHVNRSAAAAGAAPGMTVPEFATAVMRGFG